MSFWELLVVIVVALLVLGPQRLPQAAHTVGRLLSKFREFSGSLQTGFEEQMKHDNLNANEEKAAKADQYYKEKESAAND